MKNLIGMLERKNIFTPKIGFVRVLLATGALLTLFSNDLKEMTDFNLISQDGMIILKNMIFKEYSIFELLGLYWGKIVSILILLFIYTGYFPQITTFLQAWVHFSICNSFLIVEGGDQIASNLSILLIPICLFDNRINQWNHESNTFSQPRKSINVFFNVYYFLISLQVATVYLHASIGKFYKPEWRDGTCLYYWFTNNTFGAPYWPQKIYNLITLSSLAPIFSWSIMIFELCLFGCIFSTKKSLRKFFLLSGLAFHFAIIITHGLVSFFFSMAAALILYIDDDNIIYTFVTKIKNKIYGIKI